VKQLLQSSGGIFMKNISLLFIFISLFGLSVFAQKDKKIDTKEIIEKHLEAIGTAEKRALNRTIAGDTEFKPKVVYSPMPSMKGKNVISSDKQSILFLMAFPEIIYPNEQFAFDGKTFSNLNLTNRRTGIPTDFAGRGSISPLTIFAEKSTEVADKGLIGGILTTAWCLQNLQNNESMKTEISSKKVDGHEAYVISLTPSKMRLKSIKVFIDKSNFQHFRTEYRPKPLEKLAIIDVLSTVPLDEIIVESFSDFKIENGLTLPHTYQIKADLISFGKLVSYEWKTTFSIFLFDQKMNADLFQIKTK
jgi:hypothetical protein